MGRDQNRLEKAEERVHKLLADIILPYHNIRHALYVRDAARQLCDLEGISEDDKELVEVAALFHDTGFIERYDSNEFIGARIASESLPAFGYTREEIGKINGMICATMMPQKPENKLEQIICDADLAVLGKEDFWTWNEALRQEMNVNDKLQWYTKQLPFIENHTYFTDSARNTLQPIKEKYIADMKAKITYLEKQGI